MGHPEIQRRASRCFGRVRQPPIRALYIFHRLGVSSYDDGLREMCAGLAGGSSGLIGKRDAVTSHAEQGQTVLDPDIPAGIGILFSRGVPRINREHAALATAAR